MVMRWVDGGKIGETMKRNSDKVGGAGRQSWLGGLLLMGGGPKSFTKKEEGEEEPEAGTDQFIDLGVSWLSHLGIPGM